MKKRSKKDLKDLDQLHQDVERFIVSLSLWVVVVCFFVSILAWGCLLFESDPNNFDHLHQDVEGFIVSLSLWVVVVCFFVSILRCDFSFLWD
jgi:hypothetical protein